MAVSLLLVLLFFTTLLVHALFSFSLFRCRALLLSFSLLLLLSPTTLLLVCSVSHSLLLLRGLLSFFLGCSPRPLCLFCVCVVHCLQKGVTVHSRSGGVVLKVSLHLVWQLLCSEVFDILYNAAQRLNPLDNWHKLLCQGVLSAEAKQGKVSKARQSEQSKAK